MADLTHILAQQCDLAVGDIVISLGDLHTYSNHELQIKIQLEREPRNLPQLNIKRKLASIYEYKFEDFEIVGYEPHPHIKAPVAI